MCSLLNTCKNLAENTFPFLSTIQCNLAPHYLHCTVVTESAWEHAKNLVSL